MNIISALSPHIKLTIFHVYLSNYFTFQCMPSNLSVQFLFSFSAFFFYSLFTFFLHSTYIDLITGNFASLPSAVSCCWAYPIQIHLIHCLSFLLGKSSHLSGHERGCGHGHGHGQGQRQAKVEGDCPFWRPLAP